MLYDHFPFSITCLSALAFSTYSSGLKPVLMRPEKTLEYFSLSSAKSDLAYSAVDLPVSLSSEGATSSDIGTSTPASFTPFTRADTREPLTNDASPLYRYAF